MARFDTAADLIRGQREVGRLEWIEDKSRAEIAPGTDRAHVTHFSKKEEAFTEEQPGETDRPVNIFICQGTGRRASPKWILGSQADA
jgi:hypothetical protein